MHHKGTTRVKKWYCVVISVSWPWSDIIHKPLNGSHLLWPQRIHQPGEYFAPEYTLCQCLLWSRNTSAWNNFGPETTSAQQTLAHYALVQGPNFQMSFFIKQTQIDLSAHKSKYIMVLCQSLLGQSCFWAKVFPGQSRHQAKIFSEPKVSLDRSISWTEVCLRSKYVWGQSECGTKVVLGPNWVLASTTSHLLLLK